MNFLRLLRGVLVSLFLHCVHSGGRLRSLTSGTNRPAFVGCKPVLAARVCSRRATDSESSELPAGTSGGVWNPNFLRKIAPFYNRDTATELMGPLLYSLVRSTRPTTVVELGAGCE